MKKTALTLITIIAITATTSAQIRFGIKGGLNLANQSVKYFIAGASSPLSPDIRVGFHAGVLLDVPLSKHISIQPNLLFSQKGFKLSSNTTGTFHTGTYNYIELPVNVIYHINEKFSIGAGPYLGYALSGTQSSGFLSVDIPFGSGQGRRLDFGLNALIGYEIIDGLVISSNYSLGLANISDDGSSPVKNNVIGVSLTKFFESRK